MQIDRALTNLHSHVSRFKNIRFFEGESLKSVPIHSELKRNGYCLLRNTNLHSKLTQTDETGVKAAIDVQRCLYGDDYAEKSMDYGLGTDDRSAFVNALQSVSVIPPSLYIPYHSELCYTDEYPRIIAFICIIPSKTGGQTPICDTVRVFEDMDDDFKQKFARNEVLYMRNLDNDNNEQVKGKKSWQSVFDTNEKEEAERKCVEYGYDYKWLPDSNDILRVAYKRPAVIEYDDGIKTFANSVLGMHGSYFDAEGYEGHYDEIAMVDRPHHSQWGDGTEFTQEELQKLKELCDQNSLSFDWEEGDMLVLDNLQWAHGRMPYEGHRIMTATMGVPCYRYG